MTAARVLAIGLDPGFADFSTMPQLTPDMIRGYIDVEIGRMRDLGFEVDLRLVAPDDAAEGEIEKALQAGEFDCVAIGAGLREPREHLILFERILNLVHRLAPGASIVFNSAPADTAQAVQRGARYKRS